MNDKQQTQALVNELSAVIERFRQELDVSYAQTVGALQLISHDICCEARGDDEDELVW